MKNYHYRFLFLFVFILFTTTGFSQDILWEKSLGGKQADYLMDAQPTADYGFILVGSSLSVKSGNKTDNNNGDLDYWIWKMNEDGDLDWQKNFGGSGQDKLRCIKLTNDGGFILAGSSTSDKGFDKKEATRGDVDFWIIKLDATGNEQWQRTIGGTSQDELMSITTTRDGGYVLGGSSSSEINGDKTIDGYGGLDYWIVKLDNKGKTEWQQVYGGQYNDIVRSVEATTDGGFLVGGSSNSPESGNKTEKNYGFNDYWILKLDTKGKVLWQKTIGGEQDDQLNVVHQTFDNGFILGGNSNSDASQSKSKSNEQGTDFWVVKLSDEGKMLWQETYNIAERDVLISLVENNDHTLLLGGYAQGETSPPTPLQRRGEKTSSRKKAIEGTDDYVAIKINETGQELWRKTVGSNGQDLLKKVIETRDGGYLLAGTSNPQAFPVSSVKQKSSGIVSGVSYSNGNNQAAQDTKNDINKEISNTSNEVNDKIKNTTSDATSKVKDGLGMDKDSPLKLGAGDSSPLTLGKVGDGKAGSNPLSGLNSTAPLPRSGDKKKSYGNNDFWVVKLKDKDKPKKEKATIETFPNPTSEFTNVIVGYDFETGTATVADLAGHVLQTFEITSRTVPIDLSAYPEGIYVVNIKTNVQSDGVKVIKRSTKN
jgi:hypothetical protein